MGEHLVNQQTRIKQLLTARSLEVQACRDLPPRSRVLLGRKARAAPKHGVGISKGTGAHQGGREHSGRRGSERRTARSVSRDAEHFSRRNGPHKQGHGGHEQNGV